MNYKVSIGTKIKSIKKGSGILVLEPDDYSREEIQAIRKKGYKVLGYLSVGSIEKYRSWYKAYKKYGLRPLEDWPDELYADVRKTNWRCFLVTRAKALKKKGFDGFWCDNIDVYSEYKSTKMFSAIKAVLKQIKAIGGYIMINGGSEWVDDALDRGEKLSKYINGYTQEEVFSRIIDYSGKGKFGKQRQDDRKYYQTILKRAKKAGAAPFLLEYTKDEKVKASIKDWCKDNKASYYISGNVKL